MFQPTAHFFDETLGDRNAKPQTGGTCVVEALEGHENVVDLFFRDSGAVVDHADFHAVLHGAAGQQHLGIRGVRAGVDQQVTQPEIIRQRGTGALGVINALKTNRPARAFETVPRGG